MRTRIAAVTVTASLLGAGAAGALLFTPALAGAQDASEEATGADTPRGGWVREALAGLVDDGTLTGPQAEAVAATLADARPDRRLGHRGVGVALDTAADAIGITTAALRAALGDGDTLAEVAEANGVDAATVVDALVAELEERLDERVTDGGLTQERADDIAAGATERLTTLVEEGSPAGGHAHRGWGHRARGGDGTG